MCGIAGTVNFNETIKREMLEMVSRTMAHRGPDDEGIFIEGPVGLAHRRLSVIDLEGGVQPMFNEDRTLVVVFNGEIYNHIELRVELQTHGHIFSTVSDTEVVLHGFEEWGESCVNRFNGMFAFALYNRSDKSLFLSRDRCGEKPLYYMQEGGRFIFASELQTLLSILEKNPDLDLKSVYLYLRLGYIPAPRSFFCGIQKLKAGSSLKFKDGSLRQWLYYEPNAIRSFDNVSEEELCEELDNRLSSAVEKMLISDVPLGAFLSGGLDSSLIVAMMAKKGEIPKTFSISFDNDSFDESQHAKLVSDYVETKHTHYNVILEDFDSSLSIMDGFGEPFADSSAIPTYYLARETRKDVTVALSGDGGDELFGGYRRYLAQKLSGNYLWIPSLVRKGFSKGVLSLFPDGDGYYADSILKSARIFVERAESTYRSPGIMLNMVFSHDEVVSLFPELPNGQSLIEELIGTIRKEKVEALMRVDRILYLPDDILVKVDRMSMKNSLEVRVPYLDPGVLDLSERIPLKMKIRGRNLKYLLKKVALKYLPSKIVHRKKHGFMVPMAQWLKESGEGEIRKRMPSWVDSKALDKLIKPHFKGFLDNSHKIFALIVLGRYLK
ncbi:MAG: asparagine synthase (glutamine-hydrolyzing) [Pseudomonadota bacterium]